MAQTRKKTASSKVRTSKKTVKKEIGEEIPRFMESVFNAITDGITVIDRDFRITHMNRSLVHFYGYDKIEDAIGKKCYEIFRNRKRQCPDCYSKEVFKTGRPAHHFMEREDIHGRPLIWELNLYPIRDEQGRITRVVYYSRNVTKERMLEEEVRESEKKLRDVFSVSRDMVAEVDTSMKITFITENCKKFVGYTASEITGRNFLDLLAPESKKMALDNFKARVSGKKVPSLYEMNIVRKDGVVIPIEVNISIKKKDKKIIGIVATARDISERKLAEDALKKSEKRYRTLFEKSPESITLLDVKGDIIDCNKATEKLVGFKKKEIVGKHFDKLLTIDVKDLPLIRKNYRKLAKGLSIKPYELEITQKSGLKRWIYITSSSLKRDGEVIGFQVISRDITDRRQAEEKLRESEALYRILVETSPDGITLVDMDTNIIMTNAQGAKNLGYTLKEVQGMNAFSLMAPEDQPRIMETVSKLVEKGRIQNVEFNFIHKNGSRVPIEYNASLVLDKNGEPIYLLGISRNVSERKKAEEELRESEEKYSNLFEKSNDAIFLHNLKGDIIDVNQKALDLLGYPKKEIKKLNISRLHPKKTLETSKRAFKTISKKGHVEFEVDFRKKNGDVFLAEVSSSLFEIGGKKVIQGIVRDITERKRAEIKLRESEERYRMLLDQSGDVITYFDLDGRLVTMNQNAARGLGGTPDDFIGKSIHEMFEQDISNTSLKRIRQVGQSGKDQEHEDFVEFPTGKGFFRSFYHPLRDATGNIVAIQIISHDITEKKLADEKIKELAKFNAEIVQSMKGGIMILDVEGIITFINPEVEKKLGYKRKELIGESWEKIIAEDYYRRMRDCFTDSLDGKDARFEAMLVGKDKSELSVLISASPRYTDKVLTGILMEITDISGRRRERIAREELMKFKIKRGNTYLIKGKDFDTARDVSMELYKNRFKGIVISREHPEKIRSKIDVDMSVFWMTNDPKDKISVKPDFTLLEKIIDDEIDRDTFVLLDRFDYLVTQNGFMETLNFIQHLNEMFYARKSVLILSFDPSTLNLQELSLLEKETTVLERRREERLSADLFDLLDFVNNRNRAGEKPSYKDVGNKFRVSRTTARKRISELADKGLIIEEKHGRFKYLAITEKGKASI